MPVQEYVERRNGGYYLAGSRVSLASIVYEFRDGASPETIRQNFSTLSLEQVYGAIAFYLGHQTETAAYLAEQEAMWEETERTVTPVSPELQKRIEDARKRALPNRSRKRERPNSASSNKQRSLTLPARLR
jgi:uncharacterized protein (DUF433 family)